jgi:hypothetical protein
MVDVMAYFQQVQRVPGTETISVSPAESNRIYEEHVMPLAVELGAYPIIGG